jgi:hypothetical protein
LQIVNDFWALVRGYGVQFLPVCQSVLQLRALFKDEWENYAGQAGVVVTIGPPGDTVTAEWMSKRSGTTTIWQEGWSEGEGTGGQGMTTNLGESRSQVERAFMLPQELMSMKLGTGRIWPSGHGDISIPFFAPNYWQRRELRGLIDPNPYFEGGASAGGTARAAASARDRPPFWNLMEAILVTDRRLDSSIYLRKRLLRHPVVMARELADIYNWQPKEFFRNLWLRKPRPPQTAGKKLRRGVVAVCILGNLLWVPALLGYDFAATVKAVRPLVAEYAPALLAYFPAQSETSSSNLTAFDVGKNDWMNWYGWVHGKSGDLRYGIDFWSEVRNDKDGRPFSCSAGRGQTSAEFRDGCEAARKYLTVVDKRRASEPDYKQGWNAGWKNTGDP